MSMRYSTVTSTSSSKPSCAVNALPAAGTPHPTRDRHTVFSYGCRGALRHTARPRIATSFRHGRRDPDVTRRDAMSQDDRVMSPRLHRPPQDIAELHSCGLTPPSESHRSMTCTFAQNAAFSPLTAPVGSPYASVM